MHSSQISAPHLNIPANNTAKKTNSFKNLLNVFKPIREWLHTNQQEQANYHHTNHSSSPSPSSPPSSRNSSNKSVEVNSSITSSIKSHDIIHDNRSLGNGIVDTVTPVSNPHLSMHFRRTANSRMSLPIMYHQTQQNNLRRQAFFHQQRQQQQQKKQPSLGYIFLQFNGETKQATLPDELTTIDTIQALFVCSFPNLLTMEYMAQRHIKIYIYNSTCNLFYELRDIEEVKHESVLRIHQSDPLQAFPQFTHMAPKIPPPKPRRMIPYTHSYQATVAQQPPHQQPPIYYY